MSEAEVIITVDIDEHLHIDQLYNMQKQPPFMMRLDSCPLIIHTMFNLFGYGFAKFTFVAPLQKRNLIKDFISQIFSLFKQSADTGFNQIKIGQEYYSENETALQKICQMVRRYREQQCEAEDNVVESQNILIIPSNCYIDAPPSIFLDVHRQQDATLTIIHGTALNHQRFENGCIQICQPINMECKQQELTYHVSSVSFFAYLDQEKLSGQFEEMIHYPLSVLNQHSDFKKYKQRPVGIIIATEILLYFDNKYYNIHIDLYEDIIQFLCEQAQLNNDTKHKCMRDYVNYERERGLQKQSEKQNEDDVDIEIEENKIIAQKQLTEREKIFQQYAEIPIEEHINATIVNCSKRKLIVCSFQFTEAKKIQFESQQIPNVVEKIVNGLVEYQKIVSETDFMCSQSSTHKIEPDANRSNTLRQNSSMKPQVSILDFKKIQMQQPNKQTENSGKFEHIDLSQFNGGMFNITTLRDYLQVNQLISLFQLTRLKLFPTKCVKFYQLDYNFYRKHLKLAGVLENSILYKNNVYVTNQTTFDCVDFTNITDSTIYDQSHDKKEKVIQGKISNCIIYEQVEIGPDVQLSNCVVMQNTQINGKFVFKDCLIGSHSLFEGAAQFEHCYFKYTTIFKKEETTKYENQNFGTQMAQK